MFLNAVGIRFLSEEVGLLIKEGSVIFQCYKKSIDSTKTASSPPGLTAQKLRPHRQV